MKKSLIILSTLFVYSLFVKYFILNRMLFEKPHYIIFFSLVSILFTLLFVKISKVKNYKMNGLSFEKFGKNAPVICYITDNNHRFIMGDRCCYNFFEAKNDFEAQRALTAFEKSAMNYLKEKNIDDITLDYRLAEKQLWNRIEKIPILDKNNKIKAYAVIIKSAQDEKIRTERKKYISTITHDLVISVKTQIKALKFILKRNDSVSAEQKNILENIILSNNQLLEVLDSILNTYKYENEDIYLNYEKNFSIEITESAVKENELSAKEKNITIKKDINSKNTAFYGDKTQIKKALENLINECISNAARNTEIIYKTSATTNEINIDFTYTLPKGFRNNKTQGDFENELYKTGANISLYLAKQIIEAHRGKIQMKENENDTIVYNVELPYNAGFYKGTNNETCCLSAKLTI